jgi:hypothetical protein
MKIESQELMIEFYEKNKESFPELTFEQIKECCGTQYLYAKKEIESGKFPTIRLKYFGTFLVYPKRAEAILRRLTVQFKELKLDAKTYFEKKTLIENFLQDGTEEKI